MSNEFKSLNVDKITDQIQLLQQRVEERFPGSGLNKVVKETLEVAQTTKARAEYVRKPITWLRGLIFALISIIVLGVIGAIVTLAQPHDGSLSFFELIQVLEAAINDIVFIGIAIFFLSGLETRLKRTRTMAAIDELRSLAHVIDMHQLTKDPEHFNRKRIRTKSSPEPMKDVYHLRRYLDYCSEALSLVGKLAAVYAESLNDQFVLTAVNEIENLTTDLSRKIWQKIMVVHSLKLD